MSHSVWFGQRWCVCLLYFYIFFFVFKKEKSKYFLPLSKFMYKCLTVLIAFKVNVYVIHQKHFCTSPEKLIVGHYSMVVCKLKICISAPFFFKKHKHRTKISIGHNQEVLWTRLDLSPPQHLEKQNKTNLANTHFTFRICIHVMNKLFLWSRNYFWPRLAALLLFPAPNPTF